MSGINPIPTAIDITIYSKNFKFTEENTLIHNYGNNGNISFIDEGTIKQEITLPYLSVSNLIELKDDVPFYNLESINSSLESRKKQLDIKHGLAMKLQDKVVASIIIALAGLYILYEINRSITVYRERRKKLCTWQTH